MSPRRLTAEPRGDEAELYADFAPTLLRVVGRDSNVPRAIAEEACAAAWERLLRCQPDRHSVRGWLIVTARHEAWRLLARERDAASPFAYATVDVEELAQARVALVDIAAALAPRQRRLIGLQAAGHSRAEIAVLTGDSPRTVDRQLARARTRLRSLA